MSQVAVSPATGTDASFVIREHMLNLPNGHKVFAKVAQRKLCLDNSQVASNHSGSSVFNTPCNTLVVVHGGPGLHMDHKDPELLPDFFPTAFHTCGHHLARIVFYDQLGCGKSDKPNPCITAGKDEAGQVDADAEAEALADLYSLDAYVRELDVVLQWASQLPPVSGYSSPTPPAVNPATAAVSCAAPQAAAQRVFVLGHSWGGQLVLEHLLCTSTAADQATGGVAASPAAAQRGTRAWPLQACVAGAIVSNAPLCEATYGAKQEAMRAELDQGTRDWYRASDDRASGKDNVGARVYRYLIGRGEDRITGAMAGWSALGRGGLGATRCLFITCDDDTIPFEEYPRHAQELGPDVRAVVMHEGCHAPFQHPNTKAAYWQLVADFLRQ